MSQISRCARWASPLYLVAASLLLLAGCAGQTLPSGDTTPVQSPNDERVYRYIVLDNGLQALLISDPTTDKAAAALDVNIGSSSNPTDRGGLAHFLEHMLFLGTDKYPDPSEYAEFISEHGGSRNAYTAFEHTNYYFDVNHAHLESVLDRFAQFFVAPRFDEAYVQREKNAVEAEYQLSIKTDGRRNLDVFRELANPDHPFSILGVGTLDTLADRPDGTVRDDLLDFYQRYYSANLMALAVLGRESLDELEDMVRVRFSAVPNHDVRLTEIEAPLYEPERLPLLIHIRPESSQRQLQLSFSVPDYRDRYREKPLEYLANLVGHEGRGSLLSLLKAEGWAESLGAGSGIAYRGGAAFNISITLTALGMQEREQVLARVFEYLDLLREEGPQRALYEEQGQLAALQFEFREKGEPMGYVRDLAGDMHYYAPRDVLRGNFLMDDYRPRLIEELLERYLVADNAVITVVGKDVPVDRESTYYGTPFSAHTLGPEEGLAWRQAGDRERDPRLHLPAANSFIAEDVAVKPLPEAAPQHPELLLEKPNLRVWYHQSERFRIPKGGVFVNFRSPLGSRSVADTAAAELYVALLRDSVNEYTYPALLAGLNFSFYRHARGISLKVSGYDDKQLVLLERIVDSIRTAQLDSSRYYNIRDDLVRSLENIKSTRPFNQVMGDSRHLLLHGEWGDEALLAEMRELEPAAVQAFAEEFWSGVQADVLINGNHDGAAIEGVAAVLQPLLKNPDPGPLPDLQVVRLEPGPRPVYPVDVEHDDAVLFWYLQAPADDWQQRAHAALTGKVLKTAFFEDLRTEQQLGYVVSAFYWPLLDVPGLAFLIQSPTASAVDLTAAVDEFVAGKGADGGVTLEQFERHRQALVREILEPHKNLPEESDFYWREIARRQLDFDSRQRLAEAVRGIDFSGWRSWYRQNVLEDPASVIVTTTGRWGSVPAGPRVDSAEAFKADNDSYRVQ